MKAIYINARFLTQPLTGVQRFASEISKELMALRPDIKFVCPQNIVQRELAILLRAEKIGRLTGHLWEQTELPIFLKKNGSPLLINFGNTGPLFYKNTIVTIHDLSIFMFPEAYSWKFYQAYKYLIPRITKNAKKVITVSHGVKHKMVELLDIPEKKIEIVYNAAFETSLVDGIVSTSNPYGNYILTVASFNPIKNLPALIRAFTRIKNREIKLIIVGAKQKAFSSQDLTNVDNKNIIFTGHIESRERLISLYKNAQLFVFPSLYESFGIPNLEAMSCRCPVISSNAGSLPEICSDAALYVEPTDVQDIADKIDMLLTDYTLRSKLVEKGIERSQHFTWSSSAKKVLHVIEEVV